MNLAISLEDKIRVLKTYQLLYSLMCTSTMMTNFNILNYQYYGA